MAFQQLRGPAQCRVHAALQHKWAQQCIMPPPPCGKFTSAFTAPTASIPTAILKSRLLNHVPACSFSGAVNTAELDPGVAHEDTSYTEEDATSPEVAEISEEAAKEARGKLWFAAVKPPMYTVCIIPVLVGAALAYQQSGAFLAGRCAALVLASVMIIAWLNLSNDAFDANTGVDGRKAESIVNLTGNRTGILLLANAFLLAGGSMLWRLVSSGGDSQVGPMLAVAVAMGYLYQGPPFRLSYRGLGEPLCFVAFGPLATTAFYLTQVAQGGAGIGVPPGVWAAAAAVGCCVTTILFCSHFHQIEGDRAAGKMSPLVRLGPVQALKVLKGLTAAPYAILGVAVAAGSLPLSSFVAATAFSVIPWRAFITFAQETHLNAELVAPLKRYAIKWHTAMGLGLCLGLSVSARF